MADNSNNGRRSLVQLRITGSFSPQLCFFFKFPPSGRSQFRAKDRAARTTRTRIPSVAAFPFFKI